MWNYFRVENEHTTNCGMFRATLEVPLPFEDGELTDDEDDGEDDGGGGGGEGGGGSGGGGGGSGGGGGGDGGKGGGHGSSDDESEDGDHNLSRLSVGLADETQRDETSIGAGGGGGVGRRNSRSEPGGEHEAGLASPPRGPGAGSWAGAGEMGAGIGGRCSTDDELGRISIDIPVGVPASPLRGRGSMDDELRRISIEIPVGVPASPLRSPLSLKRQKSVGLEAIQKLVDRQPDL